MSDEEAPEPITGTRWLDRWGQIWHLVYITSEGTRCLHTEGRPDRRVSESKWPDDLRLV